MIQKFRTRFFPEPRVPSSKMPANETPRWLWVIDFLLVVPTIFMAAFPQEIVFFFHINFVILAVGAFYWQLRGFVLRIVFWVPITSLAIFRTVQLGITPFDELIEIPLLTVILFTVYFIASRRASTQDLLERQNETIRKMEW